MHCNYYFLKKLTPVLEKKLNGSTLVECFSQNKDELILAFSGKEEIYIRAYLRAEFCCLSFPQSFNKANKNAVTLFPEILGHKVKGIKQYLNERSFHLEFDNKAILLFKMHGNNSNILLFKKNGISLFKNSLKNDLNLNLQTLDCPIDQTFDSFKQKGLKETFPAFGKLIKDYLYSKDYYSFDKENQWRLIQNTLKEINNNRIYLSTLKEQPLLTLVPLGNLTETLDDPMDALNKFFSRRIRWLVFTKEKNRLLNNISTKIKKSRSYISKANRSLNKLEKISNYKQTGDNIMAYLHMIKPGSSEVTVDNIYSGDKIRIKLNPALKPQKNAERYYRKAKNQGIEIKQLQDTIIAKESQLKSYEKLYKELKEISELKQLRQFKEDHNLEFKSVQNEKQTYPYWQTEYEGFQILIGKNAKANDQLTQKYAWKEDLWLHVKDVPGSHVLIKYQANRPFSRHVIERAAELAAFYSKRKSESLCPVIVTPRKFVRKRKGDPPGSFVVEREEVIMVEPKSL